MNDLVSRGFRRRRSTPDELADGVPPGQYVFDTEAWGFRVDGMVAGEREWTGDEFR